MKYEAKIGDGRVVVWPVMPKSGAKVSLLVTDGGLPLGAENMDLDPEEADALAAALVATAAEVRRMRGER